MRLIQVLMLSLLCPILSFGQEVEHVSLEQRVQQLEARLEALGTQPPAILQVSPETAPVVYPNAKLNGSVNADAGWYHQTPGNLEQVGDYQDGAAFRRARLGVSGQIRDNINYFFQMDFGFLGRPTFTDVYFEVTDLPWVGKTRIGQWKQPYSIEIVSSFRHNPWLERSPVFLLSPFRRIGVGIFDHSQDELFTWALSVVKPGNDQYGGDLGDDGGFGVVGRFTAVPVFDGDSEKVLHLGSAFYVAEPGNNLFRIGTLGGNAPEFALNLGNTIQPSMVDTGLIPTNWYSSVQSEAALIWGPLSLQAEGAYSYLTRPGADPVHFWAGYVGTTWFLTGEHRQYDPKKAAFSAVKVTNEFNPTKNCCSFGGAWELTARLSYIDASDRDINGGELLSATAGVNWWLNANTRLSFNYIHAWLDKQPTGQTEADVFAVRAQIDF
jgi:phosphate-selective porin OprO/OprP